MLITFESLCRKYNIKDITGILHIGAHECEELQAYLANGIKIENIYWVEAMENKVKMMKDRHAGLNIFQALIDLEDNRESPFYITNNGQSSSILEFGSHATNHPHVSVVDNVTLITTRLDTLIFKQDIPIENINFLNLDIQGVELKAIKSMEKYLPNIKYIYTEANTEEVYKGCDLLTDIDQYLETHGFKRIETSIYKQYGWGDAFYSRV